MFELSKILSTPLPVNEFYYTIQSNFSQIWETNERPNIVFDSLPKLCSRLFGSKNNRGYFQMNLNERDESYILNMLDPNGYIIQLLLKFYNESNCLYETNFILAGTEWGLLNSVLLMSLPPHFMALWVSGFLFFFFLLTFLLFLFKFNSCHSQ